ncbi:MAG TPA: hypothetical protein VMS22_10805 [Candidatus Eisenbacteria bacterium]|nr:hypothetical protein [Candidatus Eisenbacteria bacterium]
MVFDFARTAPPSMGSGTVALVAEGCYAAIGGTTDAGGEMALAAIRVTRAGQPTPPFAPCECLRPHQADAERERSPMTSRSVVVLMVALQALVTSSGAAVLCQRRSGAIFVRDACRKRESSVDPNSLGLVGAKGDQGPNGAPGQARAYGCSNVSADGTLVTACADRPSTNIVSVVPNSMQDNATCFVLDPSIDAQSAIVLVTFNDNTFTTSGTNIVLSVAAQADLPGCPANSVKVGTARTQFNGTGLVNTGVRLAVNLAVM